MKSVRCCLLFLSLALLFALPARADFISEVLGDSPRGFWLLNDAGATAADSSSSAIIGTYQPGVIQQGIAGPSWVPGSGLVANFNGSGNITFAAPMDLGVNGFTIGAWINPTLASLQNTSRIVASGRSVDGYGFGTAAGGELVFSSFSRHDYFTTTANLLPNQWYYVGVVLDTNNDAHFYVNGVLVETVTGIFASIPPALNFNLGSRSPPVTDEFFTGGVAGVSIYDTALTAAQILEQYNGTSVPDGTFSNFQPANVVVGQPNFTSEENTSSQTVTAAPTSVAVSVTGKMAIGGEGGNRVLIWNSIPITNGAPADVVVGQADFNSTTPGTTASTMSSTEGVAFSPDGGKLLICDRENNRVLIWNTVPTTNGAPADVVVGQNNFTSSASGISATKLDNPTGVLVTPDGHMLITDNANHRVLIYNSVPTTNGAAADSVIGQTLLTDRTSGGGKKGLTEPWQSAWSGDGKLLVADSGNNRVMVYGSLAKASTIGADVVIGQINFGQTSQGTSATQLFTPQGVAVSANGQLAIGERRNNRVLVYDSIPTSDGAAADVVLGQPNFDTNVAFFGGVSARSMATVFQLAYAPNGRLLVSGNDMHRVMIFGTADALPSVLTLPATMVVPMGAVLNGSVNPNGNSTDVHFEYSVDPALAGATSTATQNIGDGLAVLPVTASVTGLLPRTTYYFRVVATNSLGTFRGGILSFYTAVLNWGGTGSDASNGALDASLLTTNGTQIFTNVNAQNYNIAVTTLNLNQEGPASHFGSPDWWFEGSAPGRGYGSVTFRFYDSLTNQPFALAGIDFRLMDADRTERFRNFGYWDANNNFVSVSNTSDLLSFSHTPIMNSDGSIENGAAFQPGDQPNKWIELNLSTIAITGFTFQAHRQTQSAGSVMMSNLISPWAGWRTTYFGPPPFPASSDDLFDADGDGNVNLMEYFFGTDPTVNDVPNPLQMSEVLNRLTLSFPRSASATDITATVQGADSVDGPWTALARSVNGAPFVAMVSGVPVLETGTGPIFAVRVGDQYLVTDPAHPIRFLRLVVVH